MSADHVSTAYDRVLYPSSTFPETHPNRLATVAYLRGLQPAPVNGCRVLELGCGAGGNLIPMAFHLPDSEFVGLDLAQRPIASGQSFAAKLGLSNLTLRSMDLREARVDELGHFDFIIAHGVYSWVPQPVRERILGICQDMLNPQGVAYISYNAYPGSHFRDLARGMMRFHVSAFESFEDKLGQARGLLKFISESRMKPDYYVEAIRAEFGRVSKYIDAAFFHDDLNEVNQPFYLYEFIADAKRYRLQFVGEATASDLNLEKLTPEATKKMAELEAGDAVIFEQFKDFLVATGFRRTLLCRAEIDLAPDLVLERVRQLYLMSDAVRVEGTGTGDSNHLFRRPRGDEVATTDPLFAAALDFLSAEYPRSVSFEKLVQAARAAAGSQSETRSAADSTGALEEALLKAYHAGFLFLNAYQPEVVNQVTERPATSKLARFQLARGNFATSQLHVSHEFPDPFARQLVVLLDGTRDQAALTRDLIEFAKSTGDPIYENGVRVTNSDELPHAIGRRLPPALASLARAGMLVG
ncbi:MAG: methyltransferase regulatory domain-containing protein [Verrucomicrobia bacterium]|nr:methyltransferase regulatory domain-containing protein [Verrucomicrobiota bacterium]MBV8483148.1 methyltransferase regulatory domain-containing protein [Verrucomicrobiota bacterium]